MRTVTLSAGGPPNFLSGSDGAFYTPVRGIEERCHWCGRWGHIGDLYFRQVPGDRRAALVCGRHVRSRRANP